MVWLTLDRAEGAAFSLAYESALLPALAGVGEEDADLVGVWSSWFGEVSRRAPRTEDGQSVDGGPGRSRCRAGVAVSELGRPFDDEPAGGAVWVGVLLSPYGDASSGAVDGGGVVVARGPARGLVDAADRLVRVGGSWRTGRRRGGGVSAGRACVLGTGPGVPGAVGTQQSVRD